MTLDVMAGWSGLDTRSVDRGWLCNPAVPQVLISVAQVKMQWVVFWVRPLSWCDPDNVSGAATNCS